MVFYVFVTILSCALLSAISFIYFLIRKNKYGKKPLFISIVFCIIFLGIAIPMGQKPSVSFNEYKEKSSTFSFENYSNDQVNVGTFVKIIGEVTLIEVTIDGEENRFFLETEDGTFYAQNNSNEEIKNGEILTVYGKYAGKRNAVSPAISVQYFER